MKLICPGPTALPCMSLLSHVEQLWLFILLASTERTVSSCSANKPSSTTDSEQTASKLGRPSLMSLPVFMHAVAAGAHLQCTDTTQRIWRSPNTQCHLCLTMPRAWCIIAAHQTHSTDGQMRARSAGLDQIQAFLSSLTNWPQQHLPRSYAPEWNTVGTLRLLHEVCQTTPQHFRTKPPIGWNQNTHNEVVL